MRILYASIFVVLFMPSISHAEIGYCIYYKYNSTERSIKSDIFEMNIDRDKVKNLFFEYVKTKRPAALMEDIACIISAPGGITREAVVNSVKGDKDWDVNLKSPTEWVAWEPTLVDKSPPRNTPSPSRSSVVPPVIAATSPPVPKSVVVGRVVDVPGGTATRCISRGRMPSGSNALLNSCEFKVNIAYCAVGSGDIWQCGRNGKVQQGATEIGGGKKVPIAYAGQQDIVAFACKYPGLPFGVRPIGGNRYTFGCR